MRKLKLLSLLMLQFVTLITFSTEKPPVPKWTLKTPFEQKVFIENLGQYAVKEQSLEPKDILFGTRQDGLRYFFTKDGLWIMNYRSVKRTEHEIEKEMERCHVKETVKEGQEEKEWMWKFVPEFHQMQFIGANPNVELYGENQQSAVHNFYAGKKAVVAHGWKKLIYKNLYPGIDMELIFPEDKTGFKYTFIVQPGVDPSIIKIKYPENDGLQLSNEGNIMIGSSFGQFTDHAPIANEANTGKAVDCSFKLQKGVVQFTMANYDASKGLIIDPYTSTPVFTGGNNAFDVDWDNGGNCYVYGGTAPFQVLKFNPTGGLIWTYTTTFPGSWYYGDFAVDHNTGACYMVDGFNGGSGAGALKINTNGTQVAMFGGNSLFQEMWRISFSKCTNQAVIAGGGTSNPSYSGCYLDTNLANMNPVNVINSPTGLHDMWGLTLDAFGNAYFATAKTQVGSAGFDNIIYKVPTPALSPITWQTPEGYNFVEVASCTYAPGPPNGFSGMTMSNSNLYSYDSYVLKRWSSATGAMTGSASVNGASAATMTWGGLTADDCDNLFMGSQNSIKQYNSALAQVGTIAAPGMVFDCELGKNNILYSCGAGFVMATQINLLPCSILQTTDNITNAGCSTNGSATITVTGGTPAYTITWNTVPPQTGPILSNVPAGTYIATIIDNSCIKQTTYDTVIIAATGGGIPMTVNSGSICPGASITLTANGATSYTWSAGAGLSGGLNNPSVTATPTITTTYTVSGSQTGCVGTITATVTINPLPTVTATTGTICLGQGTATLTASGASTYAWSGAGLGATTGTTVTATPGATTIYTITGTDVNGCVNTGTTTVNVNPLPNVTSSSSTVCPTGTGTIIAGGATSYTWNTGANTPSISNAPAATTVYTVTGTDANGCISAGTGTITVNNVLVVTASSNSPICLGATLNLSTPIGVSWAWTGPNGFSSTTQNPTIPNTTAAATGSYSVTATDAFGCFGSTTVPVTINPLPVPTIGSNSPLCVNQNLNLNSGGGTAYMWSGPAAYSSAQQNPVVNGVTMAANGVYTVTVTDANSCVNTATINITVNPLPVVTATGATVCLNTSINLNSTGGVTYSWLGPNSFGSNLQNPTLANATAAMAGSYVVTVTDANNCSNSNTAQVTVNPLLVITASNNGPICAGATLNITSSSGVSWNWSGPNAFASTTQNGSIVGATPNLSGTYTVNALDANGCPGSATTNVTVNPLPVPVASNNAPICVGATLTFTGGGGPNYGWTGPGNFTSGAQSPSIAVSTMAMNGTYTLTIVDANNCVATTTTQVLINPLPVVTVNSGTICINNSTMLIANGATTYSWSPALGLSATVGNNIMASPLATSVYLVTGVDGNGCVNTANSTVTVNSLPPVAVGTAAICLGQTTGTLTASGAVSYVWGPVNGLSASTGSTVTSNPLITTIYTVTGTDANGCVNTATTTVTVNPIPVVSAGPQTTSGCAPICVNFVNTTLATGNCSWAFGDGSISNSCSPNHCFTGQGTFKSVLTLTDANGCVGTSTATVNVYPVPTADFNASPQPTSILDPTIHFVDATTGATIAGWSWSFGDPLGTTAVSQNPVFVYQAIGFYNVVLAVVSDKGCVDTTIKVIKIDDEFMLYVPNAFSPNADGVNDTFLAKGEGVKDFKMYIFDRWGNLTFLSDDLYKGWDGRLMGKGSGDVVQEDVYVWKIELKNYKGEPRQLSGTVSLLK